MKISAADDLLVRVAGATGAFQRWLAGWEEDLTGLDLEAIRIDRPIFICGLARGGSTLLLELLASLPGTASHQYRDFPFVFIPCLWNAWTGRFASADQPVERAHKDRIRITRASPEAFEEPIWRAFFPELSDSNAVHRLTPADRRPAFDRFYQRHLRKILGLRQANRYLSKGNYNVTRIEYLADLFPDATFIVPVRAPWPHVRSLVRQHRLFCEYASADRRVARWLAAAGHFEFGPQRRPVQTRAGVAKRIVDAWQAEDDALGYALQWAEIYSFVDELRQTRPDLSKKLRIVRHEDLCADPPGEFTRILEHVELSQALPEELKRRLDDVSPARHSDDAAAPPENVVSAVDEAARRFGYEKLA